MVEVVRRSSTTCRYAIYNNVVAWRVFSSNCTAGMVARRRVRAVFLGAVDEPLGFASVVADAEVKLARFEKF